MVFDSDAAYHGYKKLKFLFEAGMHYYNKEFKKFLLKHVCTMKVKNINLYMPKCVESMP